VPTPPPAVHDTKSISGFLRTDSHNKIYTSNRFDVTYFGPVPRGLITVGEAGPSKPQIMASLKWQAISVQVPACEIKSVSIPYFGSLMNVGVIREFMPLLMTCYDIRDNFELFNRTFVENWISKIHYIDKNGNISYFTDLMSYTGTLQVIYVGAENNPWNLPNLERTITFHNAYPALLGELQLSNETSQHATFDIQWKYDYYSYK